MFGANAERGSFFAEYKFNTRPTIENNYERYSSLDYDNQDYVRWLSNNTSYAEEPEVWHSFNVSLRLKRGGHQIQLGESTRYRDEEQNIHDEQAYDYAESPYVEVRESNYKHKRLTNFLTARYRYSYTKSKFQAGAGCTYTFFYDQSETLQLQNKFSFTENLLSPYASMSYPLTPKWQFYLSYGMGHQVPSANALNPYVSTAVPGQVSYGNPHLRPQTGHVLGLSSNIRVGKVNIYASTGYERYRDLILQHSFLDQAGMLHVTYDNIGRRQEWKNYVNASSKLTGTTYAQLDAGLYYTRYPSNDIYAANAGWAFSTSGSVSQELPANFNISGGGGFNTAWIYMQGRGGKNYYYNLRVDKRFPMRRITLSAEARSFIPLHYDSRYENQSAGYFCTTRNRGYHASFVLSFRWNFGIMQTFWKNRDAMFMRRYKGLGLWALPNMLLFQFIIPTVSPLADVLMILGLFSGNAGKVLLYYLLFLLVDAGISIMAYFHEREKPWVLFWIIPQRLCYRWIMYFVLFKSYKKAIKGELQSWGVLKRTGNVKTTV